MTSSLTGNPVQCNYQNTREKSKPSRPVPFNLSNIGHASHAESEVFSVEGSGYRPGDGGLSHARRPVEAQDLPLGGATQLAHCYKFLRERRSFLRGSAVLWVWLCRINEIPVVSMCVHLLTNMRFLTSSIPWWSSSRTSLALSSARFSSLLVPQGMLVSQSR